ncbi:MAG: PrsW family intramembrane metalloprotease [Minisyncoccia bacterium]
MNTLGIIIGFLPGLAWLFFYLREDPHPEPKYLIFITFISGIIAAILSFLVQYFINDNFEKEGLLPFNQDSTPLFIIGIFTLYAFIEEIIKFFTTFLTVYKNKDFDEPVDAMIYIIVNALGFATLENIGVLTNNKIIQGSNLIMFQTASLRFVGATLLHTLASGIIGYFWAISIREFGHKKPLILGVFLATVLHTLFNFFIIIYGNSLITISILFIAGLIVLTDFEKLKYKKL